MTIEQHQVRENFYRINRCARGRIRVRSLSVCLLLAIKKAARTGRPRPIALWKCLLRETNMTSRINFWQSRALCEWVCVSEPRQEGRWWWEFNLVSDFHHHSSLYTSSHIEKSLGLLFAESTRTRGKRDATSKLEAKTNKTSSCQCAKELDSSLARWGF
jgi:hypothetical protein